MSLEVMGVEMSSDLRGWGDAQRRVGSIVALVVAVALLVAAVVVYLVLGGKGVIVYWTLLVLVAVALLFQLALLVLRPKADAAWAPEPAAAPMAEPAREEEPEWSPPPEEAPPAPVVRTLTLRCSDCGTVFDIADTGERPLRHVCPGCGAEGTLRDEAMPAPEPAPAPAAPVQHAQAVPPATKRLKLRCGGCKEVFTIEDTGERPLRRPCPYCGRTGEVR